MVPPDRTSCGRPDLAAGNSTHRVGGKCELLRESRHRPSLRGCVANRKDVTRRSSSDLGDEPDWTSGFAKRPAVERVLDACPMRSAGRGQVSDGLPLVMTFA